MGVSEYIRKATVPTAAPRRKGLPGPPSGPPFAGIGRMGALGRYAGADTGQHLEQYQHNCGYVYSIIRTIANRIVGQPIRHARKSQSGKSVPKKHWIPSARLPLCLKGQEQGLRNFTDSAILAAFREPNPIMVRYTVMFNTVASLELTGKAYWWLRWGPGRKPEIWPLPSHWVTPVHTPSLYSSWIVEPGGGSDRFSLPGSDVVYFYYPDPADPLSALAPLTALARTVMADESLEESQRRTFLNTMNPGLAITIGQSAEDSPTGQPQSPVLTRDQRKALKAILKEEYRGTVNHGEPMILDGFIKDAKPIFSSPKELDFLNSGTATKSRLAQGWGVNPISMGEVEGANRASSAVADDHLINNVVNPRISMYSEIMTRWLPRFFSGRRDEVVYIESAASKDIDWELQRDTMMFDRGAKSINEWREGHGMPPIKDGARAYVPQGPDSDSGGWEDIEIDRDQDGRPDGKPGAKWTRSRRVKRVAVPVVKLVDSSGHEHAADGKFGHGSGGGHVSGDTPHPSAHGKVDDSDKEFASRATTFMAKIKEHGAKAVAVAKELNHKAKYLAYAVAWHAYTSKAADEIIDNVHDYSKIINAKGTGDWLSEHLGVSGNFAAVVSSHVLSYGLTKLKQFVSKQRGEAKDKMFDLLLSLKVTDDDDDGDEREPTDDERAEIVHKCVTHLVGSMGCPKDQLPTLDDVKAFLAHKAEAAAADDESADDDDADAKAFPLPRKSVAAAWGVKAVASHWREQVDHYRKELSAVLTAALDAMGERAVREIRKHRGGDPVAAVDHAIDAAAWEAALKAAAEDTLLSATKSGAAGEWLLALPKAAGRMETKSGLPKRIIRVAAGIVAKLLSGQTWGRLVRGIVKAVKSAVGLAHTKGRDIGDAAASVVNEPLTLGAHADKAADVEASAAINGGRHAAFSVLLESGKVKARRWMTCRDSAVRDAHRKAQGQVARGDAPFVVGGEECMYPGDPSLSPKNRCRCRCVSISIR